MNALKEVGCTDGMLFKATGQCVDKLAALMVGSKGIVLCYSIGNLFFEVSIFLFIHVRKKPEEVLVKVTMNSPTGNSLDTLNQPHKPGERIAGVLGC